MRPTNENALKILKTFESFKNHQKKAKEGILRPNRVDLGKNRL